MWEEAEAFLNHLCKLHARHENDAVVTTLTDVYNRCIEERRRARDLLELRKKRRKRRIGGVIEPY